VGAGVFYEQDERSGNSYHQEAKQYELDHLAPLAAEVPGIRIPIFVSWRGHSCQFNSPSEIFTSAIPLRPGEFVVREIKKRPGAVAKEVGMGTTIFEENSLNGAPRSWRTWEVNPAEKRPLPGRKQHPIQRLSPSTINRAGDYGTD
jgi:hypothetical protein